MIIVMMQVIGMNSSKNSTNMIAGIVVMKCVFLTTCGSPQAGI